MTAVWHLRSGKLANGLVQNWLLMQRAPYVRRISAIFAKRVAMLITRDRTHCAETRVGTADGPIPGPAPVPPDRWSAAAPHSSGYALASSSSAAAAAAIDGTARRLSSHGIARRTDRRLPGPGGLTAQAVSSGSDMHLPAPVLVARDKTKSGSKRVLKPGSGVLAANPKVGSAGLKHRSLGVEVYSHGFLGHVQPGFGQLPAVPPASDSAWVYPQGDLHGNTNGQVPFPPLPPEANCPPQQLALHHGRRFIKGHSVAAQARLSSRGIIPTLTLTRTCFVTLTAMTG